MATQFDRVSITRWQNSQHPSMNIIMKKMKEEGLRAYEWSNSPNHRYGVRSHNYHKVLYVLEGSLDIALPESNQSVTLKAGDRIDIPSGVRHGLIVGNKGAKCVEASIKVAFVK